MKFNPNKRKIDDCDGGALTCNDGVMALIISIIAVFSIVGIVIWILYEVIKAIYHAVEKHKKKQQNTIIKNN